MIDPVHLSGMIMGAAVSTVYYNLKLRHPTVDMPIIDYDLAVLIQPMLMLGISIGVAFNVVFADWMVTVLLIILFIGHALFCCNFRRNKMHSAPGRVLILCAGLQAHRPRPFSKVLKHGRKKPL